ncbi:MAG TPA: hypothetical protein VFA88_08690 [Gaiellaceae bacterium]|nr:hypothetical protein [Gaiellaceae bacterium]
MARVEAEGITTVELAHSLRQATFAKLEEEVVMVRHQAIRVDPPAIPSRRALKPDQEQRPVEVAEKDRLPVVASRANVIVPTGDFYSRFVHSANHAIAAGPPHRLWTVCCASDTAAAAGQVAAGQV